MTESQVLEKMLVVRDLLLESGFSRDVVEVALSALLVEVLPVDHRVRTFMPRFGAAILQDRPGTLQRHLDQESAPRRHPVRRSHEGLCEVTAKEGTRLAIVTVHDRLEPMLLEAAGRVREISTPVPPLDRDQPSAGCGQQNRTEMWGGDGR